MSKVDYTVCARIVGYLRTSNDNAKGLEQLLTNLGALKRPKIIQVLVFFCLFIVSVIIDKYNFFIFGGLFVRRESAMLSIL